VSFFPETGLELRGKTAAVKKETVTLRHQPSPTGCVNRLRQPTPLKLRRQEAAGRDPIFLFFTWCPFEGKMAGYDSKASPFPLFRDI
jgi:hypothetical protein